VIPLTRVLIVEGDNALRDRYAVALGEDGYDVLTASDFTEALAKNLLHSPELVVMDPGADRRGLEFAIEVARVNSHARVIFNTPDPYQYSRDFHAWVADGMAEKCGDAAVLVRALRRLSPRRTPV
jgi:DNA-binding NarL/FixJ family response regulator